MHGARQGCGPREDDAVQRLLPLSSSAWRLTLVETDGGARAYRVVLCRVVERVRYGQAKYNSQVPLPDRAAAGDGDSSLCLITI